MGNNILEEIAAQRRLDVAAAKRSVPAEQLAEKIRRTEDTYGPALCVLDRLYTPAVRRLRRVDRALIVCCLLTHLLTYVCLCVYVCMCVCVC